MAAHSLIGFTQPESPSQWPLRHPLGETWPIVPSLWASSGETVRHLGLAGLSIACLSDLMTARDRAEGALVEVLSEANTNVLQPIHAVYYRDTALAARITCFLDYLNGCLGEQAWTRDG